MEVRIVGIVDIPDSSDVEVEVEVVNPGGQVLSREKIRVNIVEVQPKFSVGKTYETYVTTPAITIPPFTGPRRVVRKLRTGRAQESKSTDESGGFVEIGDPAIQVEDEV